MDFDETREIGRSVIVEPVIIGEPGVGRGERNEFAGTRMIQRKRPLLCTI